jgi:exodeoxyribonuclease VII small subunit
MPVTKTRPAEPAPPLDTVTSFEAALERLTAVVERLEGGEIGLEESLALFEEGVRLARTAQERLDGAEKRVEELVERDENGEPVSRELEPE